MKLVEVAGIEPASRDLVTRTSTYIAGCNFLVLLETTSKFLQNQPIVISILLIGITVSKPFLTDICVDANGNIYSDVATFLSS